MNSHEKHQYALRQAAIAMRIGDPDAARSPVEDAEWCIRAYLEASGLVLVPKELTEDVLDAGADAYHEAREIAVAKAKARNDEHEKAGRGRIAPEHAFPNDWLAPVYLAMISAFPQPLQAKEGEA